MTEFVDPGMRSDSPLGGPASPGAVLRRARESAGLHIAALAVSLKVPVKKLEALEADRFDLLTDAVFVRALAGSVCRSLKLDPQAVLPLLPPSGLPRLDNRANDRVTPSFRTPSSFGSRTPWWTQVSRPAVLAGLAFVVGAALLFLLPKAQDKQETSVTTEVVIAAPVLLSAPAPALVSASAPGVAAPEAALPAPAVAAAPTASPVAATPPLPTAVQPIALAAKPAAATAAPAQPAAASTNLVTFTTTKASWIEVTDARGTAVLRRQLAAGEVVGVSGVPPLKALVGRVDGTQVQVRGQALDLAPLSKDNVARFEVK